MVVPTQPGKHKTRADHLSDKRRALPLRLSVGNLNNEKYAERASYGQKLVILLSCWNRAA